jgi:hypothetical protein
VIFIRGNDIAFYVHEELTSLCELPEFAPAYKKNACFLELGWEKSHSMVSEIQLNSVITPWKGLNILCRYNQVPL